MDGATHSCLKESPRQKPNDQTERKKQRNKQTELGRPQAPQQGSSANGGRPWPSLADTEARPPSGRAPVRLGDPLSGPRQPVSLTSFDVSKSSEGQTTSESYETRTVVPVSKRASQRFENHDHTTLVLREKPRKPRKHAQKGEPTTLGRPPSPPTGELGHGGRPWPSLADTEARPSNGRAPVRLGDPLLGPRQPVSSTSFDVSRCLEGQTTSESYETRTVVSVSKIASQRFENHVGRTSVLREKPRKPKEYKIEYLLYGMTGSLMGSLLSHEDDS